MFDRVPIAQVAEYWDRRPCNIRHSPRPVGSREYFDEVEKRKYYVEPHIPRFAEFPRWKGKRVLEIGCGIGTDTVNFARAGAEVTAVDLSEKSLEVARARVRLFGLTNVRFFAANAEELDRVVPPEPYDLVYSFGVVHHTPHPRRVFDQVLRHYTRSGSTVKVMVYHRHSYKVLWILLTLARGRFWRTDEFVARYSEAQTGCPVTYSYSRRTVRELLRGLEIDEVFVDHIFPFRIPEYVRYRYVKPWYFRALPRPFFRWMERRFGWHLCVTAHVP